MNDLKENGNWFNHAVKLSMVAGIFENETLASFEVAQENEVFSSIIDNNMELSANDLAKKLIDYANEELI